MKTIIFYTFLFVLWTSNVKSEICSEKFKKDSIDVFEINNPALVLALDINSSCQIFYAKNKIDSAIIVSKTDRRALSSEQIEFMEEHPALDFFVIHNIGYLTPFIAYKGTNGITILDQELNRYTSIIELIERNYFSKERYLSMLNQQNQISKRDSIYDRKLLDTYDYFNAVKYHPNDTSKNLDILMNYIKYCVPLSSIQDEVLRREISESINSTNKINDSPLAMNFYNVTVNYILLRLFTMKQYHAFICNSFSLDEELFLAREHLYPKQKTDVELLKKKMMKLKE